MKWNGRFPRGWPKRKSRRRVTKLPCLFVDVTSFRSVKLDRGFLFSFFPFRCRRNRYHFLFSSFSLRPLFSLASFSLFCRLLFPFLLSFYFILFYFFALPFFSFFFFIFDLFLIWFVLSVGIFFSGEKPRFRRFFFFFYCVLWDDFRFCICACM